MTTYGKYLANYVININDAYSSQAVSHEETNEGHIYTLKDGSKFGVPNMESEAEEMATKISNETGIRHDVSFIYDGERSYATVSKWIDASGAYPMFVDSDRWP